MPIRSPTPKVEFPEQACFSKAKRLLWLRQSRHFYLCLFLLSRKVSNAMIKPLEEINKLIISRKTMMVSYVVIGATSLPMYSGKPVIGSGDCHPCRGFHVFYFSTVFHCRQHTPHQYKYMVKLIKMYQIRNSILKL